MNRIKQSKIVLNELLVDLFHDILEIEEKSLRDNGSDLTMTEMHTIHAVGHDRPRTMSEVAKDLNITMVIRLSTTADATPWARHNLNYIIMGFPSLYLFENIILGIVREVIVAVEPGAFQGIWV